LLFGENPQAVDYSAQPLCWLLLDLLILLFYVTTTKIIIAKLRLNHWP